jgi:hypothetical protein
MGDNSSANATAVYLYVSGEYGEATADVVIGGDASAQIEQTRDGEMSGAVAIGAYADDGGKGSIDVKGSIIAESVEPWNQPIAVMNEANGEESESFVRAGTGIQGTSYISSTDGGDSELHVLNGGIEGSSGYSSLVYIESTGENSLSLVDVVGDIVSTNAENMPWMTIAASANAGEGGTSKLIVDGNVSSTASVDVPDVEGPEVIAGGVDFYNDGGQIEGFIGGDVTVSGADINYGISIGADEADECTSNIIVDGTIDASDIGVVLVTPTTQLGNNVALTVWAIVPSEENDNAVVASATYDGAGNVTGYEEDEEAEKQVQYIVRIKAGQEDIISTRGTSSYRMYDVAHEDDIVTLELNIPEGFTVTAAYSDVAQQTQLEKNAAGQYFLTMPRGGAVELSVELASSDAPDPSGDTAEKPDDDKDKDKDKDNNKPEDADPTGEPAEKPDDSKDKDKDKDNNKAKDADSKKDNSSSTDSSSENSSLKNQKEAEPILKVKDLENKIEIKFFKDKTFIATMENGTKESGTFSFKDGKLVLKLGSNNEIEASEDNTFVYTSKNDSTKMYRFKLTDSQIDTLKKM